MEEEIKQIDIIPAIFLKYREDGNVLLKCLEGDNTADRAFEPKLFTNIENLNYLFIGVITGKNMMQINACDGNEYEDMFREKWNLLIK